MRANLVKSGTGIPISCFVEPCTAAILLQDPQRVEVSLANS